MDICYYLTLYYEIGRLFSYDVHFIYTYKHSNRNLTVDVNYNLFIVPMKWRFVSFLRFM